MWTASGTLGVCLAVARGKNVYTYIYIYICIVYRVCNDKNNYMIQMFRDNILIVAGVIPIRHHLTDLKHERMSL